MHSGKSDNTELLLGLEIFLRPGIPNLRPWTLEVVCGCPCWSQMGFWGSRATRKLVMKLSYVLQRCQAFLSHNLWWLEPPLSFTCTSVSSLLSGLLLLLPPTIYFPYHSQNNSSFKVWVSPNHITLLLATFQCLPSHSEVFPQPTRLYMTWSPDISLTSSLPFSFFIILSFWLFWTCWALFYFREGEQGLNKEI